MTAPQFAKGWFQRFQNGEVSDLGTWFGKMHETCTIVLGAPPQPQWTVSCRFYQTRSLGTKCLASLSSVVELGHVSAHCARRVTRGPLRLLPTAGSRRPQQSLPRGGCLALRGTRTRRVRTIPEIYVARHAHVPACGPRTDFQRGRSGAATSFAARSHLCACECRAHALCVRVRAGLDAPRCVALLACKRLHSDCDDG